MKINIKYDENSSKLLQTIVSVLNADQKRTLSSKADTFIGLHEPCKHVHVHMKMNSFFNFR